MVIDDCVLLQLRKRRMGQNARGMAHSLGVKLYAYRRMEQGRYPLEKYLDSKKIREIREHPLDHVELCIAIRKQLGVTGKTLAEHMGVTHGYLKEMETLAENPARLIKYWLMDKETGVIGEPNDEIIEHWKETVSARKHRRIVRFSK